MAKEKNRGNREIKKPKKKKEPEKVQAVPSKGISATSSLVKKH